MVSEIGVGYWSIMPSKSTFGLPIVFSVIANSTLEMESCVLLCQNRWEEAVESWHTQLYLL